MGFLLFFFLDLFFMENLVPCFHRFSAAFLPFPQSSLSVIRMKKKNNNTRMLSKMRK